MPFKSCLSFLGHVSVLLMSTLLYFERREKFLVIIVSVCRVYEVNISQMGNFTKYTGHNV